MECGCNIEAPEGDNIIVYCPMHEAAPLMLEMIEVNMKGFKSVGKLLDQLTGTSGYLSGSVQAIEQVLKEIDDKYIAKRN